MPSQILGRGTLSNVNLRCASDGAKIFCLSKAVSEIRLILGAKFQTLEGYNSFMGLLGTLPSWNPTCRHLGITLNHSLAMWRLRGVFGRCSKIASYAIVAGKSDAPKFLVEVTNQMYFCAVLLIAPNFFSSNSF